jgi:hypothetical protein
MSVFNPKYKIRGQLQGGVMTYTIYYRSWLFVVIPYWKRLSSQLLDIDEAVLRVQTHAKQNETRVALWIRIR